MLHKITLLSIFLLFSCSGRQEYYHGYVYDGLTRKPLAKVMVKENLPGNAKSTYTDAKGYFKIENKAKSFADLIFSASTYQVDTLPTIWSQHGESLRYSFINSKPDTVFLMLEEKH